MSNAMNLRINFHSRYVLLGWRIFLLVPLLLFGLAELTKASELTKQITQDFRREKVNAQFFMLSGPYARAQMMEESRGLRISLPTPYAKPKPTGLQAAFRIRGDFEITVGYELVRANKPTKGNGLGLSIYARTENTKRDAVYLGHVYRVKEGNVFTCSRTLTNSEGKRQAQRVCVATKATTGKLRLQRQGQTVTCLAAEGSNGTFRELKRFELGSENIHFLRIAADPGDTDNPLVVRVQTVDIRAEDFLTGEPAPAWPWLMYLVLFGCACLIGCGTIWYWRLRQETEEAAEEET